MYTSCGAFARLNQKCLRMMRPCLLAIAFVAVMGLIVQPRAKADVIYTFFDNHGIVLEFASPYIITPTTNPVHLTSFIVAPTGFVPCTASLQNVNTLGCLTGASSEFWAITKGPFPTTPGSFALTFGDLTWGFAADIPMGGGSISPEPASLLLFGTGMGAIGMYRMRRRRQKS